MPDSTGQTQLKSDQQYGQIKRMTSRQNFQNICRGRCPVFIRSQRGSDYRQRTGHYKNRKKVSSIVSDWLSVGVQIYPVRRNKQLFQFSASASYQLRWSSASDGYRIETRSCHRLVANSYNSVHPVQCLESALSATSTIHLAICTPKSVPIQPTLSAPKCCK